MKNKSKSMKHKVLTVKQPWSFLICSGIKDIENRTWKCPQKYIGERVLIHAGGNPAELKFEEEGRATAKEIKIFSALGHCEENELFSAIIGSVEIVDCVINHTSIWAERAKKDPWYEYIHGESQEIHQVYNWVLANPILFDKPILNVKGKLGFWDYDLPEEYETILKL